MKKHDKTMKEIPFLDIRKVYGKKASSLIADFCMIGVLHVYPCGKFWYRSNDVQYQVLNKDPDRTKWRTLTYLKTNWKIGSDSTLIFCIDRRYFTSYDDFIFKLNMLDDLSD